MPKFDLYYQLYKILGCLVIVVKKTVGQVLLSGVVTDVQEYVLYFFRPFIEI